MNLQATDNHRGIKNVCLLALAGVLLLAGCSFATAQNKSSGWMRSFQPAAASASAADMASRPTNLVTLLAGPAGAETASSDTPDPNPSVFAPTNPWLDPVASSGIETVPLQSLDMPANPTDEVLRSAGSRRPSSQPTYPPLRLVSEKSLSVSAQHGHPQLPSEGAELARGRARPGSPPKVGGVLHASTADFDKQVLRSDVPVLVDFYAVWCGPCKALAPTLEDVAMENPQAKVVKVNIDDSPELAARYGVKSIPSLMVFKDGRVVAKRKGLVSKAGLKMMLDLHQPTSDAQNKVVRYSGLPVPAAAKNDEIWRITH